MWFSFFPYRFRFSDPDLNPGRTELVKEKFTYFQNYPPPITPAARSTTHRTPNSRTDKASPERFYFVPREEFGQFAHLHFPQPPLFSTTTSSKYPAPSESADVLDTRNSRWVGLGRAAPGG